jgi:hypothetical protein
MRTSEQKHPRQPIGFGKDGVIRFKENAIVRWLVDSKRVSLNDIDGRDFPREDVAQFWQMLGYSVSGFGDLKLVSDEELAELDLEADRVLTGEREDKVPK